ncbi:MAG: pseudouridine-5'-phosphate glycosidase [Gemmatimonadaceae bacterium]
MKSVRVLPPIAEALAKGRGVVALESSVLAQGLPIPANAEAARRMVEAVEREGAVPAVTGVVAGIPAMGLTNEELTRFLGREGVVKASSRDLGSVIARGRDGSTTVAAALTLCRATGVRVFATGGIGGVHHEPRFDESADLVELARSPIIVVCAGAKSILDLPATVERLETLGVTVVGYRTDHFPGFFFASSGIRVPVRADSVQEIVATFRGQQLVGHQGALLVVQPPPAEDALARDEVETAVSGALTEGRSAGIRGGAITPYLLAAVEKATQGRSTSVNLSLLAANARLAAAISVELGVLQP